jgi:hypothetical protein
MYQDQYENSIEAARKLIARYREITLDDIQKEQALCNVKGRQPFSGKDIALRLTGYGDVDSCMLCLAVNVDCDSCIYSYDPKDDDSMKTHCCTEPPNEKTYIAISEAKTAKGLLSAFRKRADHIEKLVDSIEVNQAMKGR